MDQKHQKMSKAGRRQHVLSFARHDGIYPQSAKKSKQNKQTAKYPLAQR